MLRRPTFLGMSGLNWWERREADAIDAVEANELADAAAISRLQTTVSELTLTFAATMKVLAQMCQIDMHELEERVKAELDAMRPKPLPTNNANPHKAVTPQVPVTCAQCGRSVLSTQTTITERGTVCDVCAAT
jgi:hypothetical protein